MPSALIVYGGWQGHEPEECSNLFANELRKEGWKVDLANDLMAFADGEKLKAEYDLLVPCWTMGELPGEAWAGMREAITSGVGCAGWHGGMGDAFRKHCDFQRMVGGQFVGHPGNVKRWTVNLVQPRDPICAGLGDFEIVSEQYYMHVDPAINILASSVYSAPYTGATECAGVQMPVAWKKSFGEGRVFYCSLGHKLVDFDVPEARELTKRGLIWAARDPKN